MKGVYQNCGKHLHRYVAELEFRYDKRVALGVNDGERSLEALGVWSASDSRIAGLTENDETDSDQWLRKSLKVLSIRRVDAIKIARVLRAVPFASG